MPTELEALKAKLKSYESKVLALNAINSALQKENENLRKDLSKAAPTGSDAEDELQELQEEFARRLGTADRTIEQLKEEKARLQANLAELASGGSASEARVAELTESINSLKLEGEVLSKKNGELEASARKLRGTCRELELERDKLTARARALEAQVLEVTERSEREAAHAASHIEQLEKELSESVLEAKKQVAEAWREAQEAIGKSQAEASKEVVEAVAAAQRREEEAAAEVSGVREALAAAETSAGLREDGFRRQIQRLEDRIRILESEREALLSNASEASRPLLKQIESMATAHAAAIAAADEAAEQLRGRCVAAETAAATAEQQSRVAAARASGLEGTLERMREECAAAVAATAACSASLEAERRKVSSLESALAADRRRLEELTSGIEHFREEAATARREAKQAQLESERKLEALSAERNMLLARLESSTHASGPAPPNAPSPVPHLETVPKGVGGTLGVEGDRGSKTSARGEDSRRRGTESIGGAAGGDDELDELLRALTAAANQNSKSLFGFGSKPVDPAALQRSAALMSARVEAAERARDEAAAAMYSALRSAEDSAAEVAAAGQLRASLAEMERRVELALELLGERNERVDQLEEDIADMRRIFHEQLELCVEQLAQARGERNNSFSQPGIPTSQ